MDDNQYYAHYNSETNIFQSAKDHLLNTAQISAQKNTKFPSIAYIAGLVHDAGKLSVLWQSYFIKKINDEKAINGKKEDHSTAGGQLIEMLFRYLPLSQFIQVAVYSHHGLQDCINLSDDSVIFAKRKKKADNLPVQECQMNFFDLFQKVAIYEKIEEAEREFQKLLLEIQGAIKSWSGKEADLNRYGNKDFFLGMYERLLISSLMDADRRDTADFMNQIEDSKLQSEIRLDKFWVDCIGHIESKIATFEKMNPLNIYRGQVSEICKEKSADKECLYHLSLPTGAGKTLASLRFAVHHARHHHKKKIIYVAPFQSIVEQNAEAIRTALNMPPDTVLEHHCNIIIESEEEQERYARLVEDWSAPVIVTTAVQFLNTLFTAKTTNVRRMQSLSDSIIIIDEVQSIPIKTIELFNMAVNFLTTFINVTVVLCTATQPLLDKINKNALLAPIEMVPQNLSRQEVTRRVELIDCVNAVPGGMSVDQVVDFTRNKAVKYQKILLIVNTKACAKNIYDCLVRVLGKEAYIKHLSTAMCPAHRQDTLRTIKKKLCTAGMMICISTQLIEAGVDISFPCVIRSLTGLDSFIQAAGRCNRHQEIEQGNVYLIKISGEVENISKLTEMREAQTAMNYVLDIFREDPDLLGGALDSELSVEKYFELFYNVNQRRKMCYPFTTNEGIPTSIVSLLSDNQDFSRGKKLAVKQAFKTAGEQFEVITDQGNISVIVPYRSGLEKMLFNLEKKETTFAEKKQVMNKLQLYTVSISRKVEQEIGNGIYGAWDNRIKVLDSRFYNEQVGVVVEPKAMELLNM